MAAGAGRGRGGQPRRLGVRARRAVRVGPAICADAARGAAHHRRCVRDRRLAARGRLPDQASGVRAAAAGRIAVRRGGGGMAAEARLPAGVGGTRSGRSGSGDHVRRCRPAGGGGDRRDGRGGAAGGRAVAEEPDLTRGGLAQGPDGRERCWWGVSTPDYMAYHDDEWGRPVTDDHGIYERLTLEAFQSGLSWLTILRKREHFRAAFAGFEIDRVARFDDADVARLMADAGIVRNRLKVAAAITNAQAARAMLAAGESPAELVWSYRRDGGAGPGSAAELPATTDESKALARELKRRGF